ncbi:MFS transporter [Nakamurella lactea]|uniref:MFS transporter n=1 Tax=Nakamurella lactea TaxID=459515 RepID=UPI000420A1C1|nr:MFS transporter [Nakamurella lactea]
MPETTAVPTIATSTDRPAIAGRSARRLMVGISLGYFMVLLDSTILNVALPAIAVDLGGSVTGQQWTVSGYLVTFGALLLSAGAVADRFGARRVFLLGTALFGVTSLLCAVAPNLLLLILFRALQGAAAAMIPSSTLSLIGGLFPDPGARHRAIGSWALITGMGFAAGPLIGGLLLSIGPWHLVFAVNVPAALVAVLWCRSLPATPRGSGRLDPGTQCAAVLAGGLVINAVIQLGSDARHWWWTLPALAGLALVVLTERRSSAPALPRPVLRVPEVRQAVLSGFGIQLVMSGALFVLGLQLIDHRGMTPAVAGVALLPYLVGPLFGPLVSRLVATRGSRLPLLAGLVATAGGMTIAGLAVLLNVPLWLLLVGLLIAGPGLPLTLVPLTSQVVGGAPNGAGGVAGGLFNASRQLGGALGVAALGSFVRAWGPADGTGWALLAAAAVAAVILGCRIAR